MKKILLLALISVSVFSCASVKTVGGREIQPYGLFSEERKEDGVKYKPKTSAIVMSIILSETIVFPIVALGYRLYEAVSADSTNSTNVNK